MRVLKHRLASAVLGWMAALFQALTRRVVRATGLLQHLHQRSQLRLQLAQAEARDAQGLRP